MATVDPLLSLDHLGRRVHLVELDSWFDWPGTLPLSAQHFCLLLAADGTDVPGAAISALTVSAVAAGCAYLCAWGPGCEFVHDVFDETYLGDGSGPPLPTLMTTWHASLSLGDAIEFISRDAVPDEHFQPSCRDVVIAVVANSEWLGVARRCLVSG